MKIKELRELLAGLPDDAEVSIDLDARGTEDEIKNFEVLSVGGTAPNHWETATTVYLTELPRAGAPEFDFQLRLGMPDEFLDFCNEHDVTPQAVLYSFIADLAEIRGRADGLHTNGSDERMLAQQYFNRCSFAWPAP